jgi:riboflavin biosynthesis RibT protein
MVKALKEMYPGKSVKTTEYTTAFIEKCDFEQ